VYSSSNAVMLRERKLSLNISSRGKGTYFRRLRSSWHKILERELHL